MQGIKIDESTEELKPTVDYEWIIKDLERRLGNYYLPYRIIDALKKMDLAQKKLSNLD